MPILLLQNIKDERFFFFSFVCFFFVWEPTGKYCFRWLLCNEQILLPCHPFSHIIGVYWLTKWWLNNNLNANLKELFLNNLLLSHSWVGLLHSLSLSSLPRSQAKKLLKHFLSNRLVSLAVPLWLGEMRQQKRWLQKLFNGFSCTPLPLPYF